MNTILNVTCLLSSMAIIYSCNPMKMSFAVMVSSCLMLTSMAINLGTIWMPTIFFMLFMGGIIMMFMILSSILPNEKSMKIKSSSWGMMTSLAVTTTTWSLLGSESAVLMQMKSFLNSGANMTVMTLLILTYFFTTMKILSEESSPLRSTLCHKLNQFCKLTKKNVAMSMKRKSENVISIMNNSIWDLPSPTTMTYFWNFGSTLGLCLIIQIISGILLTLHYTSYSEESFESVTKIMREVWSGWVVRLTHMNGASVFFFFIYLHIFRGMMYKSSVHKEAWMSGVTMLILMMAISFLGYVLPWGQMSYWAVAVITNLFSVIPKVGENLVNWIWGGFSVGSPTLTRFYSFHFLLPFILAFLTIMHLMFLHKQGSSNSLGMDSNLDKIQFHPYFSIKDLSFIILTVLISLNVSFFLPYILGDAVNNVPANAMQTPAHIQPEWYFLPSYAILRSLPSKTAGVVALMMSVSILYFMPMFKFKFSTKFSYLRNLMFWTMIFSFTFLMKMGAMPAEEPYTTLSKMGAMFYFSSILLINL